MFSARALTRVLLLLWGGVLICELMKITNCVFERKHQMVLKEFLLGLTVAVGSLKKCDTLTETGFVFHLSLFCPLVLVVLGQYFILHLWHPESSVECLLYYALFPFLNCLCCILTLSSFSLQLAPPSLSALLLLYVSK